MVDVFSGVCRRLIMSMRDNFLTIIFKKTGRIISVNISMGIFMASLALIILLNGSLVFLTFQWGHLQHKKSFLQKQIGKMQTEVEQMKDEIKEAMYYKTWADSIIYRRLYAGSLSGQGSASYSHGVSNDSFQLKPGSAVIDSALVGIDDFQVKSLNLEMDFELSFYLVNKDKENKRISGYLTIAGMNEDVIPPVYGVFPRIDFKDGAPVDYQEGLSFAIRYLRPVKARINQPSIGPKFNEIVVMIYSTEGELILKQGFNVERMLHMNSCS